jgi:hypothetical protein
VSRKTELRQKGCAMAAGSQRPGGCFYLRSRASTLRGFRVAHGRVGFVEEVRYASRFDRPDVIAVRAGLLGRLLLIVPVGEIAEILPKEERTPGLAGSRCRVAERKSFERQRRDLRRKSECDPVSVRAQGEAEV